MPDSKKLLRETRKYARERRFQSWWEVWTTLAILALLTAVACLHFPWIVRIPAGIFSGLLMVRLFIIYHDYQHGTILRRSRLMRYLMNFYGLLTLNPPSYWNHTHNYHHRHTAEVQGTDTGTFPLMTAEDFANAPFKKRLYYIIARHPLTIALGYVTIFFYSMCVKSFLSNPREHYDSALAIALHGGLITLLAILAWQVMLMGLIVPMAVGGALGAYLFYAQHNYPDVKLRGHGDWDYVFAALHSSSYIRMIPIMHWFTGNIGYHHVHHLNARIPFYRLPEAMAGIRELQSPGTTTLHPRDVVRCLRLKLWDSAKGRLVTFRGK